MTSKLSLILGGARSGKTRLAEQRARDSDLKPVYIATATATDEEMRERIRRHQNDRAAGNIDWHTLEEPLNLGDAIAEYAVAGNALVVDCLTLWLSNCLSQKPERGDNLWDTERSRFFDLLERLTNSTPGDSSESEVILVSNETGLGVVPMGDLSRKFVDESGFLHQQIARLADRVTLVVAGLPTELKSET